MYNTKRAVALVGLALLIGCHHARIETGLAPSIQTFEQPWAASWLGGLVPPSVVETAARCPDGVAVVETQRSFVNMVAAFLTFGIYAPMAIKVTCAQSSELSLVPSTLRISIVEDATAEMQRAYLTSAAKMSANLQEPVYIIF